MKYLIFDAGPIISMTMNGMLVILERLREKFDGEFILTSQVKKEVVDHPLKIKRYELEAIQVQSLIDKKVFRMADEIIDPRKLEMEIREVLKRSSGFLRVSDSGERINIIQEGEASCIAFSKLCGCENVIVVDERTTRLLTEAPTSLENLMERKLHTPLVQEPSLQKYFRDIKYIRSTELIFVAYKRNLIPLKKDKQLLDALLYGMKFKGTAVSSQEIEEMKRLG
jgi:predicted nucleic acid-binding protein